MTTQCARTLNRLAMPMAGILFTLFSYYVYTCHVCYALLRDEHQIQTYTRGALLLLVACLASYVTLLLRPPGRPIDVVGNKEHRYSPAGIKGPYIRTVQFDGQPAWCNICQCNKPDRAHHCRQCNTCILKMDHHCIWIGGCVGQGNQGTFLQFLVYITAYALWLFVTGTPMAVQGIKSALGPVNFTLLWKLYKIYLCTLLSIIYNTFRMVRDRKLLSLLAGVYEWAAIDPLWLAFIVLSALFSAVLLGFTCLHVYYVFKNVTSIEQITKRPCRIRVDFDEQGDDYEIVVLEPRARLWDRGLWNNWCDIMGPMPWDWILPIAPRILQAVSVYNAKQYQEIVRSAMVKRKQKKPTNDA